MTILEALKQLLGSKADEEFKTEAKVETKTESVDESKPTESKEVKETEVDAKESKTSEDTPVESNENKESNEMIFEEGWLNTETGKVDKSKIKNAEVLSAIERIEDRYKQAENSRLIADKFNDELKNYSLKVSNDTLRKMVDLSNVKITKDGEVTGIKEAIDAVKSAEPGLFGDKEKESNPLNEGFNPVEKRNTENVNSFAQAFRLMEEIN